MGRIDDAVARTVPTDEEAQAWAGEITAGLVQGTMQWKRFSKREWFLEGACPRCKHAISLPIVVIDTVEIARPPVTPEIDDMTAAFVAANDLHWDFAYLACNCREGHKSTAAQEKPTPGCGFAEQHMVVVPQPDLGV